MWLLENNLAYMEDMILECNMAATITVLKVLESILQIFKVKLRIDFRPVCDGFFFLLFSSS